ncbi:hypothetical protein ANCCAN_27047 [Ancylostoma caninum]|uniref:Uncharacterized protein n=1 Tax=Ancylostoma caninum TaxID=29170 RepID=A0A368F520_ANCCA|nr:hypothetical protein ANCCAN_27047 [Ancylostoma caninum]
MLIDFRRRAVREKIADMPGKLDHASVVAYAVGRRDAKRDLNSPILNGVNGHAQVNGVSDECNGNGEEFVETRTINVNMENFTRMDKAAVSTVRVVVLILSLG